MKRFIYEHRGHRWSSPSPISRCPSCNDICLTLPARDCLELAGPVLSVAAALLIMPLVIAVNLLRRRQPQTTIYRRASAQPE